MTNLAAFFATVHGRVQGVNFRYFVVRKARGMGLKGYVANRQDGLTVEVYAEGEKDKLNKLLSLLYSGPSRAEVDHVSVKWSKALGLLSQFEVKY